ncbi:GTPase inhibitor [Panaeolus papilionaceus]|nr:GTPase inhibitor [Panaeolus papilionaceus]
MSNISKMESLVSRVVQPNEPHRSRRRDSDDEDDDEALFAALEEEIENDPNLSIREQGLKLLKSEMGRVKELQDNEHGRYGEITDEKEVIRTTAREKRCVVHFYHSNFKRCEIMDKHLSKLAPKYFNTRFLRVFVENVPWLVEKLAIKILPCVICFVDGVTRDRYVTDTWAMASVSPPTNRIIGFEELGNADSFDTAILELRLSQCGVIQKANGNILQPLYKVTSTRNEDEEVFDLDD